MRLRLLLSYALIVLVTLAGVIFGIRQGTQREVAMMFRGIMTGSDELVTSLADYYTINNGWDGVASLFPAWDNHGNGMGMMGMGGQRIRVADAGGRVVYDTRGGEGRSLGAAERREAFPIRVELRRVGYLLIDGAMMATHNDQGLLIQRLNRAAWIAAIIGGAVALAIASIMAYQILRPVGALTHAARQLAKGDLSQRVNIAGDDELAELGQTFNQMAGSLQNAENSRRAMTADIAHELRNPLAVQKAYLEALEDGIYPLTVENLHPALEQNELLNRLVDDLRTLAMADAGQLTLERTPADVTALAERVAERFQPQSEGRRVTLLVSAEPTPLLNVDGGRIEQILANLLSNALRYTPEGGRITLAVNATKQGVQVSVTDSGPGIPPESLDRVFERFYRADKSRSRQDGGSGLGLAIARQLSAAHGGSLTAANDPGGGAKFTLILPLT